MTLFERIVLGLFVLGAVCEVLHIPGPILTVSMLLLMFYYVFFSFTFLNNVKFKEMFKRKSYLEISKQRILGTIVIGVGIGVLIIGLLFNILIIPGPIRHIGVVYLSICLFLFTVLVKDKTDLYRKVIVRITIPLFLGYLSILYPLSNLRDEDKIIEIRNEQYNNDYNEIEEEN